MLAATLAGLGASFIWALAPLLAQRPAQLLGTFEFTRIQLTSSFAVLIVIVSLTIGWSSVSSHHAPAYLLSSCIGVVLGNLAMVACLRRGGAQKTEVLFALNAPIAAFLGYVYLDETLSLRQMAGIGIGVTGVALALLYGRSPASHDSGADALPQRELPKIIMFGVMAAACNAIGLLMLRPILISGTEPLVVTALRTGGAALIVTIVSLWPAKAFEPLTKRTAALTLAAIAPGIMGYVIAVCLQLYALKAFGTGTAALLASASPVMVLPLAWIISKEKPSNTSWAGAALVVAGTAMSMTA